MKPVMTHSETRGRWFEVFGVYTWLLSRLSVVNYTHPMTALGIDYGTKRIGLAIADGPLAEPLDILPNSKYSIQSIKELCAARGVTQIVMGLSENEMAEFTKEFAKQVTEATGIPVSFIDETLSSYEMHSRLRQTGVSHAKRTGHIDHLVAAQLLQDWLDEEAW